MEKEINLNDFGADPKIYEVGFHIIPTLAEDVINEKVSSIREAIAKINGTIIAEGTAKKMELAYPIAKVAQNKRTNYTTSYFAWFKFEAEPKGAKEISAFLKADDSIIRFLLVKTVREDTMAPRKLFLKKKEEEVAPVEDIIVSEEEIDASIEKLITE